MNLGIRNNFINYCILTILLFSCRGSENNDNSLEKTALNKEQRFELFLNSPLNVNTKASKQKFNNIIFYKSYILAKNKHVNDNSDSIIRATSDSFVIIDGSHIKKERDSLIRIASHNDVIEILKNKYTERILQMRINSKGIKLNYGIYLGMTLDSFNNLLPLKINEDYIASYINKEYFEVKFIFDRENRELKEFNYRSIID